MANHPNIVLSSKGITAIALAGMGLLSMYALSSGHLAVFMVVPLALVGMLLLSKPQVSLMLSVALYFSDISPYFFPPAMNLSVTATILFVGAAAASILMHNRLSARWSGGDFLCLLYAAVLITLMVVRGSGLKILGGRTWGGTHYIVQFAAIGLFMFVPMVRLTAAQWKRTLVWMFMLSAVRVLADVAFLFSHGKLSFQYMIVRVEGGGLRMGYQALEQSSLFTGDVFRIHSASHFGISMVLLTLLLTSLGKTNLLKNLVLWGLAILACGVAGYRSNIVYVFILIMLSVLTRRSAGKVRAMLALGLTGVLLYGVLFLIADHLPPAVQRTVSILPGIETAHTVQTAGASTVEWRIELWKRVIEEIPKYFWIGKGLVFDPAELEALQFAQRYNADNYDLQIWSREYHNGPLALMMDLGLPGAMIGFAIILALVVETSRRLRASWQSEELFACYRIVAVFFLASVAMFFLSFGDVRSIPMFLFMGSILRGIALSDEQPAPAQAGALTLPPRVSPQVRPAGWAGG